jgi:fatty-acyl-CoA synthase
MGVESLQREDLMGLMQRTPLLVSSLLGYAARFHSDTEIVTRTVEGPIHRYGYGDCERRSRQLARALGRLGVERGDRVATAAWNGHRHLELYFAISGMGAVCHTLNPRLFPEQLAYIVQHAEDRVVCVDLTFVPLFEKLAPHLGVVEHWVILTDREHMPETSLPGALCYEELVTAEGDDFDWPTFDEDTASSLCYTSGTTGNPKGVLYSHRSTVLHALGSCLVDTLGLSCQDSVLPVVPMFHANAWGLPYSCPLTGAKLVFPGAGLDGPSVYQLLEEEAVTLTAGVPTVWLMLLQTMREMGRAPKALKHVVIGGAAAPRAMIEAFQNEFGVHVIHAWGMTETSPLGTVGTFKAKDLGRSPEEKLALQLKQGRAIYGVDLRIADTTGSGPAKEQPRDGEAFGEIQVRGPWVVGEYFKGEGGRVVDEDGWFSTGDVGTLDPDGYMQITDRSKDVIKSGGEWISSIELENEAVSHPQVAEAAVIGVPHPKWTERPLLIIVPADPANPPSEAALLEHLQSRVAKWWLPDAITFVEELPHTATGKISKKTLRERFEGFDLG